MNYGDISPRTAGKACKIFLKRAIALCLIERFAQGRPLEKNNTKTQIFRRYNSLAPALTPMTEGVTPAGKTGTKTDVTVTLQQYGDYVELTDVIADTHEDPILQEFMGITGEQAAETVELVNYGILKGGTSVFYANGSARNEVNAELNLATQRRALRGILAMNGKRHTQFLSGSQNYETRPVGPCFIGLCHTDCSSAIRDMAGFVPVEKYGTQDPLPGEIGAVEEVRYCASSLYEPWADAGGDKGTMISTTGIKADVYPVIYLARDAFGVVPLRGKKAITPMVMNPNSPRGGDPLGQRGSVGWKTMYAAIILNDAWMARAECCVKL
ncbi:N4-gp56 family major capsid protein [Maridesulfovibrio ferrireducens]|uniref:N4-gp56 family major capsid protein n=1 Tax=Maridesulfovibrio ferrireducens TaxID=246191 RepID=UPI001A34E41F|nr:N4-gp56 family major capsid protein [Maridesulfovibrio ferrireducens]MBI9113176.1 N4-gp56 family major capsid protein [Maridesulfovibrio ferrireducens]